MKNRKTRNIVIGYLILLFINLFHGRSTHGDSIAETISSYKQAIKEHEKENIDELILSIKKAIDDFKNYTAHKQMDIIPSEAHTSYTVLNKHEKDLSSIKTKIEDTKKHIECAETAISHRKKDPPDNKCDPSQSTSESELNKLAAQIMRNINEINNTIGVAKLNLEILSRFLLGKGDHLEDSKDKTYL